MLTAFKILWVFGIVFTPVIPVDPPPISAGTYEYCPNRTMKVYGGHSHTAIIFIHGGGWRGGHQDVGTAYMGLVDQGFTLVTIELSLGSAPAQIGDTFCAIDYLLEHGIDRIGLIGKSSGGHVAAFTAVTYKVQAAVIISAPLDLTIGCKEDLALSIFGASCETPELLKYSPLHRIGSRSPAILLIHNAKDGVVPVKHSKVFYGKLVEIGSESWTGLMITSSGGGTGDHGGLYVNEVVDYFARAF